MYEPTHLSAVTPTQDVKGLGQRGEVVSVKRGAMRHELYPRGQAAYATPENLQLYARVRCWYHGVYVPVVACIAWQCVPLPS